MTSPAHDYLSKQLSINNNIVTYRSLSRELGVHVNIAKNELAAYHVSSPPSCATYLIMGEVPPTRKSYDDEMDVDGGDEIYLDDYDDEEDDEGFMPQTKIVLVDEDNLESSKSQFSRIFSTYIYALSPAPIRDAGLICTPTPTIRQIDTNKYQDKGKGKETEVGKGVEKGVEWGKMVGKVIGAHVVMKAGKQPIASTSTSISKPITKSSSTKDDPKFKSKDTSKDDPQDKLKPKPTEKPKATGKLDWSNAKTKDMKAKEVKKKEGDVKKEKEVKKKPEPEKPVKAKEIKDEKRGTKRKSTGALLSDSDSDSEEDSAPPKPQTKPLTKPQSKAPPKAPPAKATSSAHIRRGVIFSSDEDDEEEQAPKKRLQKGKAKWVGASTDDDDEAERSLRAMMDVDDDQVIRIPRNPPSTANPSTASGSPPEDVEEDVDVEMAAGDEDLKIKPPPRKRKPKKVIPVGRNGLKKRRVEKSRTSFDEKGYMVTEDYSSYESVSEGEEGQSAAEPASKSKAPAKSKSKTKTKSPTSDETPTTNKNPTTDESPAESASKGKAAGGKMQSTGMGKTAISTKGKTGGSSKGDIKNFFAKK
ncbi:hypothetical protein PILCRDRAFT_828402 [Piloderma croceum F 1598]|uniref:DNA polymerase delta subunit 3 n=1 Tax=Piloderma croceum (strain F 1598) TaxID=765440 RepID=A0A0C3AK48_PILCF|nr:hypothetical protein PILCRDRAFT_828402 [Piloderma croceum F 1598]